MIGEVRARGEFFDCSGWRSGKQTLGLPVGSAWSKKANKKEIAKDALAKAVPSC